MNEEEKPVNCGCGGETECLYQKKLGGLMIQIVVTMFIVSIAVRIQRIFAQKKKL